jgi:hypothetical protein
VFRVDDIFDEGKKIIGTCDDTKFFRWCGDVVSMISSKGDFEGWKGWLDICTRGCGHCDGGRPHEHRHCGNRCITLPREVETVLAVNIQGHPSLGFGTLFNFHLNGPGDRPGRTACEWSWQDGGDWHATYRDLITPAKLVAYLQNSADNGKALIVYGFDDRGQVLRREENGVWMNGYRVPTIFGVAMPDSGAPTIARITGVFKDSTVGSVRLSTVDDSGTTGVLLAVYEPDETLPQYRRITINRSCQWVRVAYRKTNPTFSSRFDHIPLRSRVGFLLGMQARKHYSDQQVADAHSFEADAVRLELEAQQVVEPTTTYMPMQVIDRSQSLRDPNEYDIR